jgi:hypothetical protein
MWRRRSWGSEYRSSVAAGSHPSLPAASSSTMPYSSTPPQRRALRFSRRTPDFLVSFYRKDFILKRLLT